MQNTELGPMKQKGMESEEMPLICAIPSRIQNTNLGNKLRQKPMTVFFVVVRLNVGSLINGLRYDCVSVFFFFFLIFVYFLYNF